jgi:hypothetical protein
MADVGLDLILSLERAVWEALVAGDAAADARLLDAGFLGVYPTGFAGRDDHAGQLAAGPTVRDYRISEARLLPLGADQVLLAYRAEYCRSGSVTCEAMFVSSIWRRDGAGWVNMFSQDTPVSDVAVP